MVKFIPKPIQMHLEAFRGKSLVVISKTALPLSFLLVKNGPLLFYGKSIFVTSMSDLFAVKKAILPHFTAFIFHFFRYSFSLQSTGWCGFETE